MKTRLFDKNKDYNTLCEWWEDWGMKQHPTEALSQTGIIISEDNIDICSGFIYSTDSYIAWVEFITSNKKATKEQRKKALIKLVQSILEKAKSMGFKLVMCFGLENKYPIISKEIKKQADVTVKNMFLHYKIL
tara:strand:- start:1428 stop:1826 length:399 start_codon:yes stop_codon:yes gene_type:complete